MALLVVLGVPHPKSGEGLRILECGGTTPLCSPKRTFRWRSAGFGKAKRRRAAALHIQICLLAKSGNAEIHPLVFSVELPLSVCKINLS
jgi:hypothetical protein